MKTKMLFFTVVASVGTVLTPPSAVAQKILHGHVPEAVAHHLQPIGRLPSTNHLPLAIGLPLRNREALANLLEQLYDPASTNYHHYLTPQQFTEQFGPSEEDYQAVIAFVKRNGLTVTGTHPSRQIVDVKANVADIEKVFHVTMHVYRHPIEQRTFFSPDVEPTLDLNIPLLHITGLDNYVMPHPNLAHSPLGKTPKATPNAGSGIGGTYLGSDFRTAYVPGVSLTGVGQTVGLLELDDYYDSDITSYKNQARLPNVPLQKVLLDGGCGSPGTNNDEVALDIEMAISMAPGLDQVTVYEAPQNSHFLGNPYWVDILDEMAYPSQGEPLPRQLSSSWSLGNNSTADQLYQQFASQGQSFFQSSGDYGAYYSGLFGIPSLWGIPQWADSPYVTIVGGTTLTTASDGSWAFETTWNSGYDSTAGHYWASGGGISQNYQIPSWQQGINMNNPGGSTSMRNVPDVAMVASDVLVTYNNGSGGPLEGTSISAPLWAGFTALVNQQAATYGWPSVGFINPAIYSIGNASAFHDIADYSNNGNDHNAYNAYPGYDLCTGLGTPNGRNLINALVPLLTTLYSFPNNSRDGMQPSAGLVQGRDGNFYGTTPYGGTNDEGTVFKITPSGTLTTLYSFTGGSDGYLPSGLVQGSDGNLYGTTPGNGYSSPYGTVFKITPSGALTTLHWFTGGWDGCSPCAGLVQGSDGNLYGTTSGQPYGYGTVFKITPSGTLTTLYSFDGFDDGCGSGLSHAGLVQGSDGNFYGTTCGGGSGLWAGTVFKITPGGTLTTLHVFTEGSDGAYPETGLVQGNDGNFYGTTSGGQLGEGAYYGTVFKITPSGTLTTLHAFTGYNAGGDGESPSGLVQGSDGNFYGTTYYGGMYGYGTVFKITPSGTLTTLHSFNPNSGTEGHCPIAELVQGSDASFYGTTYAGGTNGVGTVFRVDVGLGSVVTVQTSPSGLAITVDGTAYTAPQTFSWLPGSNHTIATTSPQTSGSSTQYVWSSWSDGGAISHPVNPTNSATYTANFITKYYLTMNAGTGGGVSPASGWYDSGASVPITATTNSCNNFSGWTGSGSGSYTGPNNSASVTINGAVNETANFSQIYYTIATTNSPSGSGTTSGGGTKLCGTNVTVTATATNSGFRFANWTLAGTVVGTATNYSFIASGNWTLVANFTDLVIPTNTITAPTVGQRWSNGVFTVTGTARDNVQVTNVSYQLNGSGWNPGITANGWSNWTAAVNLTPGTNLVQAYAVDAAGNKSTTNSVSFDYMVTNQLQVRAIGLGTISPNYSNAWLEIGRNYSITSSPAKGFVFTNWIISTNWLGGITMSKTNFQFMMASNLTLQANFVDVTKPTNTITAPTAGQHMTNALATVVGTAKDNWKVAGVWYQLNNGAWNLVTTTTNNYTNWTQTVTLVAGTNTVKAYAVDLAGNFSTTNSVSVVSSNTFKLQLAFTNALPLKTNGLVFILQLSIGLNGHIQVSTNLTSWTTLTNFVGTNSTITFRDPAATNSNRRFYRATIP